jgi:hypothetical protein
MTFRNVYKTIIILLTFCLFVSCASANSPPQGEPEPRPTLYYQNQKYDLLHSESNLIDVSDMLLKKDGPIGTMRYPGEAVFEDFDTSDARRAGDEVYAHPEKKDALIYHCSGCGEYFCITTEFVPLETVAELADPEKDPFPFDEPRPMLYYNNNWHAMDHYDGNKIDVSGRKLKYIGITRWANGVKMPNDLDVTSSNDAGYSVYADPKQPDILIYHDENADEYFSIDLK